MYRKVSLSSFHNGKVEYCAIFGSGDIEENASVIFFTQTLVLKGHFLVDTKWISMKMAYI